MDASRWLSCSLFGQQWNFCGPPGLRRLRGVSFNPLSLQRTKEFFTNKWHYTFIEAPGHRDFIKNMITDALQADTTHIMVPANGKSITTKEFFTNKWHYTLIEAPGHRDFIKNIITDALQANTPHILAPADGILTTVSAKGNHKTGEIQGQHSRSINILGVKQIGFGVNKMDCDTVDYKQKRYDEILNELIEVGWKKDFIEKNTPVLPISDLLKKVRQHALVEGHESFR